MFTGIIEEVGAVLAVEPNQVGARLQIGCRTVLGDAYEGTSIAVNGVCLTAVALTPDSFSADLAPETLQRSNLGDLQPGSIVNLERPMTLSARLSGHLVQGHVDATADLTQLRELGDGNWWLEVRLPRGLERYLVEKGSICIDGISLTVAKVEGSIVEVTIIPHTYSHTNLHARKVGDRLNIECDVLAKHVEKLLSHLASGVRS